MRRSNYWLVAVLFAHLMASPSPAPADVAGEALDRRRRELIEAVVAALRTAKEPDLRLELGLRLGKLYHEEVAASASPSPPRGPRERARYEAAIRLYESLRADFPRHERRDEILYHLGMTYLDAGQTARGDERLRELLDRFPQSLYRESAILQLGEHYYDRDRMTEAEALYDLLHASPHPDIRSQAAYRKAWCALKLGRVAESLTWFQRAVTHADAMQSGRAERHSLIYTDIAAPFVGANRSEEGKTYFQSRGPRAVREGWNAMALALAAKGEIDAATRLWKEIVGLDPLHAQNPEIDGRIVGTAMDRGRWKEAGAHLLTRLPIYLEPSPWRTANAASSALLQSVAANLQLLTRECAVGAHASGQAKQDEGLYDLARRLYEVSLHYFPGAKETGETIFSLAEIRFRRKDFHRAAEGYYAAAHAAVPDERAAQSLSHALSALSREMEESGGGANERTVESRFLAIADEYAERFPHAANLAQVQLERVLVYRRLRATDKAIDLAFRVAETNAGKPVAYQAARIIVEILGEGRDLVRLAEACARLLSEAGCTERGFRAWLEDTLRRAKLKLAERSQNEKQYLSAARLYEKYAREHGREDAQLEIAALQNAAANFRRADEPADAAEARGRLAEKLPRGPRRDEALLALAGDLDSAGEKHRSAEVMERLARESKNPEVAAGALVEAAVRYRTADEPAKARAAIARYLALYPRTQREIERRMADLYPTDTTRAELAEVLKQLAQRAPLTTFALHDSVWALELTSGSGIPSRAETEKLLALVEKHRSALRRDPEAALDVAKLLDWQLRDSERIYAAISLSEGNRPLEARAKAKLEALRSVERDGAKLASLGLPEWSRIGWERVGRAYLAMADAVRAAPHPGLSPEQLDAYVHGLNETLIAPLEAKGRRLLAKAKRTVGTATISARREEKKAALPVL